MNDPDRLPYLQAWVQEGQESGQLPKIRRLRPEARIIDGLLAGEYNNLVHAWEQDHAEVERLRGRLRELEWAAGMCPVCHVLPNPDRLLGAHSLHDPDCWLAAEIRST